MKDEKGNKLPETIVLPEIDLSKFCPKQVVLEIPVALDFDKKITYILVKSKNNKLVAGAK